MAKVIEVLHTQRLPQEDKADPGGTTRKTNRVRLVEEEIGLSEALGCNISSVSEYVARAKGFNMRNRDVADNLGPGTKITDLWKLLIDAALHFLDVGLGCWHFNISRPFTLSGHTYEVCLDCGREFPYSLRTMSLDS